MRDNQAQIADEGSARRGALQDLLGRLPLAADRPWIGYGFAIALSALAALARQEADPFLPPGFPFLTFFPAVILTAFLFGARPGTLAGVLSGLAAWYFFIPPAGSFAISASAAVAMLFYAGVIAVDIALVHLMQVTNARLAAERQRSLDLASHRELLFSELQHRVGNNLQMSASLLSLQKRNLTEPQARAAIDEASRRLGLIGRVQRQLYAPDGAQLDLATFLGQLAHDVIGTSGRQGISVRIAGDTGVKLPPQAAIPTALIVAEVVANAIEHGLAGRDSGEVGIEVRRDGQRLHIAVADDGVGLPPHFATSEGDNLGLRICDTLARSLKGNFFMEQGQGGARARLELPHP